MVSETFTPMGSPFADDDKPERRPAAARVPADKPLDATMTKTEITRALALLYNLTHRLLRIDYRFKPAEFSEEADGIYDLIQSHAPLRVIMRLASPLAAIGAMWEKIDLVTLEILRRRKEAERREQAGEPGESIPTGTADAKPVAKKAPFKP